jgi:hypothetical protein
MKNFDYGYAPTLYKNDIILNDYIPEVKPVRGTFVDDLSLPIDNPIYIPPPYHDFPPTEPPQTINPKFYYSIFIDDMPPPVEKPIELPEQPIQMPIEQPIEIPTPKFYSPLFIDDMPPPLVPIFESPASQPIFEPPASQPIFESPAPASLFKTDATEAEAQSSSSTTSATQSSSATTSGSGVQNTGFKNDSDKSQLPTKQVSKNLKPYIYAGLGIVAILIVSRMLIKKN